MKISKGDYLLLSGSFGTNVVVKATSETRGIVQPKKLEDADEKVAVDFDDTNVVANLGQAPKIGKVYGVDIQPLYAREQLDEEESPIFKSMNFYIDFDDSEYEKFTDGVFNFTDEVLEQWPSIPDIDLIVGFPKGRMAGHYKYRAKGNDELSVLLGYDFDVEDKLAYVLAHEYAHGIWYRHLTNKMKLQWVQLYHADIKSERFNDSYLQEMLEELVDAKSIADYRKSLESDSSAVFRDVLTHIKRVHRIDRNYIQIALDTDQVDLIRKVWPSAVEIGQLNPSLSVYGGTSPEEFFSEAFALTFTGKMIPKKAAALLERCRQSLNR